MATPSRKFFDYHQGTTRNILLMNGWALKFPRFHSWRTFLTGLLVNTKERKFWKKYKLCGKLNPVLVGIWGGFLNVQPRLDMLTKQEFRKIRIKEFRSIYGGAHQIPIEHDINAFGKDTKGTVLAIDYGVM